MCVEKRFLISYGVGETKEEPLSKNNGIVTKLKSVKRDK